MPFLASTGYLSLVERTSERNFKVEVPNEEVSEVFVQEIKDRFISSNDLYSYFRLREAFLTGDSFELKNNIKNILLSSFSYFDFDDEKNYQILILTLSALLFGKCLIKSECNVGTGRFDIIVYPNRENLPGYVIKIKHFKTATTKARLIERSKMEVKQIEEKKHVNDLRKLNARPILIYGIAFYKKSVDPVIKEI